MKVPVLFPIEVTSRELDARLLLAGYCVGPNRSVFLGQDRSIYRLARRWKGGVYVGKQILVGGSKPNLTKYRVLKQRGFRVLFLAEEEPVFSREEEIDRNQFLQMFHPDWLDSDDTVCAWGEFSAGVFRDAAGPEAPSIEVTGHPRFDLCKPEFSGLYQPETDAIRERFGDFILLNTKFALASNAPAFESVKNAFSGGDRKGEAASEFWLHFYCYHARMQAAYIALANSLRKAVPDKQIVVRPHPGEDPVWYRLALSGIDRVHVLTEGGVLPWLSAASALVHTGCTTALEGYYLTPRIVQFAPPVGRVFEQDLPSVVGAVCATENEVSEAVSGSAQASLGADSQAWIERIIANFATSFVSCERIGELVEATAEGMEKRVQMGWLPELEHHARRMIPSRSKERRGVGSGVPKKFEPMDPQVINAKLRIVEGLVSKRLRCRYVSPTVVEILEA